MNLVLFGGIQGVGKTTLLSWIESKFGDQIIYLDPGELFRRFFYHKKVKTTDEIEELIVSELVDAPDGSTVIAHWHYAVRRPHGFIPQISFSRLRRIAESGKVGCVALVLIEVNTNTIQERRLKDIGDKERELSITAIDEEINSDEKFLALHQSLLSDTLGNQNVKILRIRNDDICSAQASLYEFFKVLLK